MEIGKVPQFLFNRSMRLINEHRGWRSNRKIVLIESDDWGSIRMPNRRVYNALIKAGLRVDLSTYNKYDCLASRDDFDALYHVLRRHKDLNGRHPIVTANTIVANPDFVKIRESNFEEYHIEPFTETLKRYPNHTFELWKQGMEESLFFPQFHGREHLNVNRWTKFLRGNSTEVRLAFDHEFFGIGSNISLEKNPGFLQAFDSSIYRSDHKLDMIINEGLQLFRNIFQYSSKSFIAPNYIWGNKVEDILASNDVEFIQGGYTQKLPERGLKYNYIGKRNEYNQVYLIRNVVFEPSSARNKDWVSNCLAGIAKAFALRHPATICSHRVNFIGGIFEENRTDNLRLLDSLLHQILNQWPDVEFMTTTELGTIVKNDYK